MNRRLSFLAVSSLFLIVILLAIFSEKPTFDQSVSNDTKEVNYSDEFSSEDKIIEITSETEISKITESKVVDVEVLPKSSEFKVVSVTDGDTFKVDINGKIETIRVIGINTPETVHPSKVVECFGMEASTKAKKLLLDTTVSLINDPSQGAWDRYGRRLAYVILNDGRDFGEEMIRGGFAYEYTYNVPYENQSKYKSTQNFARENGIGLWAEGVCGDFGNATSEILPVNQSVPANGCTIKGNISAGGEKIYHVEGQQYYHKTIISESKGERWFCTEGEAGEAGWRKSKV